MKTEQEYSLRDGKITFKTVSYDAVELRALPDEDLLAIAEAGEAHWSYRRAARQDSHGRTFTLPDICKDIRAAGSSRTGKVTAADQEFAKAVLGALQKEARAAVPAAPEGATDEEHATVSEQRRLWVFTELMLKAAANGEKQGYVPEPFDALPEDHAELVGWAERWARQHRSVAARRAKELSGVKALI